MNRLDKAIRDFEDETLDLSLGDRISKLRDALQWAAYDRLKMIHEYGSKSPECAEMEFKQVECLKQFNIIDKMYRAQLQQNKMLGKSQDDGMAAKDILKKIKDMKSTIGDIITVIPKPELN